MEVQFRYQPTDTLIKCEVDTSLTVGIVIKEMIQPAIYVSFDNYHDCRVISLCFLSFLYNCPIMEKKWILIIHLVHTTIYLKLRYL